VRDTGVVSDVSRELGASLRHWRDRVSPAAVGLPANGPRRSPGLRREELALLAGLSEDYVTRLEQGRSTHPSGQVLAALARALQLSADERSYLFRLAGQQPPASGRISGHLTPGVQRLLRRLDDIPVGVYDAAWTLVAWNQTWAALMGDPSAQRGRERNLLWRYFTGPHGNQPHGNQPHGTGPQSRVLRTEQEDAEFAAETVADLRGAAARYPNDDDLRGLIGDLNRVSARFAGLWQARAIGTHTADRKRIDHPEAGLLTLDCDVLTVQGADLRVIAFTAEPGSSDAEKLALLRVIGLQAMSG
jgi:transcriptional regulator with XRE-family HTH domain